MMFIRKLLEDRKRRHDFDRFRLERLAKVGEQELERQKRAAEFGLSIVPVLFTGAMIAFLKEGIDCSRIELLEETTEGGMFELRIHMTDGDQLTSEIRKGDER